MFRMEVSTLFVVGSYRRIRTGALLVVQIKTEEIFKRRLSRFSKQSNKDHSNQV